MRQCMFQNMWTHLGAPNLCLQVSASKQVLQCQCAPSICWITSPIAENVPTTNSSCKSIIMICNLQLQLKAALTAAASFGLMHCLGAAHIMTTWCNAVTLASKSLSSEAAAASFGLMHCLGAAHIMTTWCNAVTFASKSLSSEGRDLHKLWFELWFELCTHLLCVFNFNFCPTTFLCTAHCNVFVQLPFRRFVVFVVFLFMLGTHTHCQLSACLAFSHLWHMCA